MSFWERLFGRQKATQSAGASGVKSSDASGSPKTVTLQPLPGPLSPLMLAAREGQFAKLTSLIAAGHDVNAVYALGGTAALMAASNGHVDCLNALIKAGASVKYVWKGIETGGMKSPTILMQAAFGGKAECIKALCAAGAEVDARDDNGVTALMVAASRGHPNCVRELVNAGANISLADTKGRTALSCSSGADIKSALEQARQSEASSATSKPTAEVARPSSDLLIRAAHSGDAATVQSLLSKGAEIDGRGLNEWTALIAACQKGHIGVVQLLLANGANPNLKTSDGETALMRASAGGSRDIVEALIAKGADLNAISNFGETALSLASKKSQRAVKEVLLSKGVASEFGGSSKQSSSRPATKGPSAGDVRDLRNLGTGLKALADSLELWRVWARNRALADRYVKDADYLAVSLAAVGVLSGLSVEDITAVKLAQQQGRYKIVPTVNNGDDGFDVIFFYPV